MKKMTARLLAVGLAGATALGVAATPASSHHSFAMFDNTIHYLFTGVVVRINPDANHLQIFFAPLNEERTSVVRGADGQPIIWAVEMGGSAASAQQGISVNGFPPGTIFSVGLIPLRNGQPAGSREEGLWKCPANTPPAAGMHCDTVTGATSHGGDVLLTPNAVWTP